MTCPLCNLNQTRFVFEAQGREYFQCPTCSLFFLHPDQRISIDAEKARYEEHENHLEDEGYLKFLEPLRSTISSNFSKGSRGLDFGCGKNPVLSHLLQREGFDIEPYDPLFVPFSEVGKKSFDFVYACEAFEHFHDVQRELDRIKASLAAGGQLFVQTRFFEDASYLRGSHYIRDITHVCFFNPHAFEWIAEKYSWEVNFPKPNIAVLSD